MDAAKKIKYVAVDPSGSFDEGKGHTGIAYYFEDGTYGFLSLAAKNYSCRFLYWKAIAEACCLGQVEAVVIESFTTRTSGFMLGKMPETSRLIGFLESELGKADQEYLFQMPVQAKSRFKDDTLVNTIDVLEKRENGRFYLNGKLINDHARDALRHLEYFMRYNKKKPTCAIKAERI